MQAYHTSTLHPQPQQQGVLYPPTYTPTEQTTTWLWVNTNSPHIRAVLTFAVTVPYSEQALRSASVQMQSADLRTDDMLKAQ